MVITSTEKVSAVTAEFLRHSSLLSRCHLGNAEFAVGAMRNDGLARLKAELNAIQRDRNNVRFERNEAGNATNFRIGFAIRPCCKVRIADVVIAAQTFVGTKRLMFYEAKSGLINVGTRNVPARSKARLI